MRHATVAASMACVGLLPSAARAQNTLVGSGNPLAKPARIDSYMRTSDGKLLWDGVVPGTVPNAVDFPRALNTFPGPTVDALMQQCYGGGFAPGMDAAISKYTFTAASNWNELTYTTRAGDNFTSSWIQSFPRSEGLYQHYLDAVNGAAAIVGPPAKPAVTADPHGPKGASRSAKYFENPVYASPDPLAAGQPDPNGAQNARDVVSTNAYAVLIAPSNLTRGKDTPRFQTNIDRIYTSLRSINIPANHIIVLYGNNAANTATAGGTPINGAATLANVTSAVKTGQGLYGDITGQTAPGNPDASAHLFFYSTGHGGSWNRTGAVGKATKAVNRADNKADVFVSDLPDNFFADADGSDSLADSLDLQFSSAADDLAGLAVSLNGTLLGSLAPDPLPENDLTDMIGTANYYTLSVPLAQLDALWSPGSLMDLTVTGVDDPELSDTLFSAVSFNDFGDDWAVGVVPEPAVAFSATILLLAGPLRRKRPTHQI